MSRMRLLIVLGLAAAVAGCQPERRTPTVAAHQQSEEAVPSDPPAHDAPVVLAADMEPTPMRLRFCSGRWALVATPARPAPCLCQSWDDPPDALPLPPKYAAAITAARLHLTDMQLLPPMWKLCAEIGEGDTIHVTCWPLGKFINSPITVVVRDGEVVQRYFSDYVDLPDFE